MFVLSKWCQWIHVNKPTQSASYGTVTESCSLMGFGALLELVKHNSDPKSPSLAPETPALSSLPKLPPERSCYSNDPPQESYSRNIYLAPEFLCSHFTEHFLGNKNNTLSFELTFTLLNVVLSPYNKPREPTHTTKSYTLKISAYRTPNRNTI